jgi:hypothetical protein
MQTFMMCSQPGQTLWSSPISKREGQKLQHEKEGGSLKQLSHDIGSCISFLFKINEADMLVTLAHHLGPNQPSWWQGPGWTPQCGYTIRWLLESYARMMIGQKHEF